MVALDPPGRGIERNCRGREKIVTWPLVSHPRAAIAGAPEGEVGLWIVVAGDPHGSAAGFPLVAFGPSLAARFARRRNGVSFPHRFAICGVERGDETPNAEFAAGGADHHLAVGDERRQ